MSVGVLIADDQALVRSGFRLILESREDIQVVGEAEDGREAIELARQRMELSLIALRGAGVKARGEIGDSDPMVAIEDALRAHQRPKLEIYGDSVFIALRTAQLVADDVVARPRVHGLGQLHFRAEQIEFLRVDLAVHQARNFLVHHHLRVSSVPSCGRSS